MSISVWQSATLDRAKAASCRYTIETLESKARRRSLTGIDNGIDRSTISDGNEGWIVSKSGRLVCTTYQTNLPSEFV